MKDNCSQFGKKMANRAVRNYKDYIPRGKAYKKLYCSWIICDYKLYTSWHAYCKENNMEQSEKNSEDYKLLCREWYRYYKSK